MGQQPLDENAWMNDATRLATALKNTRGKNMAIDTKEMAGAVEYSQAITLTPLQIARVEIPVEGVTPLIMHRWSEKSKREMLEKQTKKTTVKRAAKDPEAEYEAARYIFDDKHDGVPAVAFKAAIVGAARQFEGLTLVQLKSSLFVEGEGVDQLIQIDGKPVMREDTVRVGMGTADLRYRPIYTPWSAILHVRYVASAITLESVYALVDAAGLGGVGEWRPSAPKSLTGSYGQFRIKTDDRK